MFGLREKITMFAIIMSMIILNKRGKFEEIKRLGRWMYIYGRHKTDKTFFVRNFIGHKSSKTMEIYTHVSNRELIKIRSPLELYSKETYYIGGDENKE